MNNVIRKRTRLDGYNYSSCGAYFITVCTKSRKNILAEIVRESIFVEPEVILSRYGRIVEEQFIKMNSTYENIKVKQYSIMPDHIHFIMVIDNSDCGSSGTPTPTNSIVPKYVSSFKRFTNKVSGCNLWQRGYNDHIIRDEDDYIKYWKYIIENRFLKGKI